MNLKRTIIGSLLTSLVSLLWILYSSTKSSKTFIDESVSIYISTVFMSFIIFFILILSISYLYIHYSDKLKSDNTALLYEIDTTKKLLHNERILANTDFISGIPNQRQFEIDFERIKMKSTKLTQYHLIFIDFVNFKYVNNNYGHDTGDKIIRTFSHIIDDNMRKSENFYRMKHLNNIHDTSFENGDKFYRRYTGGDEFLFIVQGEEWEVVGFLSRIQTQVDKEISYLISTNILKNADWKLQFTGSIVPIFKQDTIQSLLFRAEEGLIRAKKLNSLYRVYWPSLMEIDFQNTNFSLTSQLKDDSDFDQTHQKEDKFKEEVYCKAQNLFKR